MATLREQIRSNSVALISLSVALIALSYNTWRNETTESQRNIRQASFRVLVSLGESLIESFKGCAMAQTSLSTGSRSHLLRGALGRRLPCRLTVSGGRYPYPGLGLWILA